MGGQNSGRVAVVGAGIVGLSVAWFLQEEGFDVTVFDQVGVAAGASAGNAGWICPGMSAPLPEPSVLRYALSSLLRRDSPLRVAPTALPSTARFLAAFALCCSERKWLGGVSRELNALAQSSYDLLARGGVTGLLLDAPVLMAFDNRAQAAPVAHELQALGDAGERYDVTELSVHDLRAELPLLSGRARHGLRLDGQRFVQPLGYVQSLAESVQARGADIQVRVPVTGVRSAERGRVSMTAAGLTTAFDKCVIANGAWLSSLARSAGVRVPMAAGRGYSFTVRTKVQLTAPLYLPALRVACTPISGGMRVAGTMEFQTACPSSARPGSLASSWPAGMACGV